MSLEVCIKQGHLPADMWSPSASQLEAQPAAVAGPVSLKDCSYELPGAINIEDIRVMLKIAINVYTDARLRSPVNEGLV